MNKQIITIGMSIILFLVSGCADHTFVPVSQTYSFNPQHWYAEGKVALRYPMCRPKVGCEEKGIIAGLTWNHKQQDEKITLFDPLGQENLQINYLNGKIYLRENLRQREITPATLTREIGIPLPLDSLADWISKKTDTPDFSADGWKITLSDWTGYYYRKMTLIQKDYYLRLNIKKIHSF